MKPSDPDDRLTAALRAWTLTPRRDPHFRPAVLERIQQRARDTWSGFVRAHLLGWSSLAVVAIAAGGWTGHAVAEARIAEHREKMAVAYLVDLDPRVLAKIRE